MPNWVILLIKKKKIATVTFSSYSNISLGVSFVAKQSFGPLLLCSAGLLSVQQWDDYIYSAELTLCFCFVLFPPGCVHSSPCTACAAIVIALSPGYSWVKTYSCTLSGQLIMDFDYSHFVLLSAAPSPTGGPAERPAPLIVSVSGLIEPNGNGCCQSSLFSSVYMLIHQRDIHYRLAENSSRHAHTHTHSHTYTLTFCSYIDKGLKFSVVCTYSWAYRCYWELMLFSNGARVYITEPLFLSLFLSQNHGLNVCYCSTHTAL